MRVGNPAEQAISSWFGCGEFCRIRRPELGQLLWESVRPCNDPALLRERCSGIAFGARVEGSSIELD
jgi:hypothetical protein